MPFVRVLKESWCGNAFFVPAYLKIQKGHISFYAVPVDGLSFSVRARDVGNVAMICQFFFSLNLLLEIII